MLSIRALFGLALLFLMLICSSQAMPREPVKCTQLSNAELLARIMGTCDKKCVPMKKCCDSCPNAGASSNTGTGHPVTGFDERNVVIDLKQNMNSMCGLTQVCCEKECPIAKKPIVHRSNKCGIRNSNGIDVTVNGFKDGQAQYGEFPWMVAVITDTEKYVGGGSLVHPRVVISAGHKIYDQNNASLVARLGDWDKAQKNEAIPVQDIMVVKVMYHDKFVRTHQEYNVVILFLQKDAALGDTVMPICLPAPDQVFADGTNCIVTGWGKDKFKGQFQTIMKAATVPAVNNVQCEAMLRRTRLGSSFQLHESFNCAGGNKEDACEGDGGSPLVCPNPNKPNEYVQMGIVAWGIGCGIPGNPGVYASIPKTVEWINKAIDTEINFTSKVNERTKPKRFMKG